MLIGWGSPFRHFITSAMVGNLAMFSLCLSVRQQERLLTNFNKICWRVGHARCRYRNLKKEFLPLRDRVNSTNCVGNSSCRQILINFLEWWDVSLASYHYRLVITGIKILIQEFLTGLLTSWDRDKHDCLMGGGILDCVQNTYLDLKKMKQKLVKRLYIHIL